MQDIQEIFTNVEEKKKEVKEIKSSFKEALETVPEYQEVQEKIKSLCEQKKRIEYTIKEQFSKEIEKIEDLKIDIESDMEMLSDIALAKMAKGENLEVFDKYMNEYEPLFKVNFKKIT